MARYVIANRQAGRVTMAEKAASRAAVSVALDTMRSATIVEDHLSDDPLGRRTMIVEIDPAEAEARSRQLGPDVIVEPEIFYFHDIVPPIDKRRRLDAGPFDANAGALTTITVRVLGAGQPLAGAEVIVFTANDFGQQDRLVNRTDGEGQCKLTMMPGHRASAALAIPEGGFWVRVVRGPQIMAPIDCPPLPAAGPTDWWHRALRPGGVTATDGQGVRVGVADTGVWDHPTLSHAIWAGAFIGGAQFDPPQTRDVDSHGTHVAGTIGARPVQPGDYAGLAPGCDLICARIFESADSGASNADIANAIDELSQVHAADLINMSIGGGSPSRLIADAVSDAFDRGTLCLIAAGNSSGPVEFPARLNNVIAVSALGLEGRYPPGTLSASRLPASPSSFGRDGLFAANFTCFGPEIDTTAPGVGIIAPVPNRVSPDPLYGVMDGTSMACPAACGALAAALSRDATYLAMPRGFNRAAAAQAVLFAHTQSVRLASVIEGRGMLSV